MKKTNEDFIHDLDGLLYKQEEGVNKSVVPKGMLIKVMETHHDCVFGVIGLSKEPWIPLKHGIIGQRCSKTSLIM